MKVLLFQLPILNFTINWEFFSSPPLALGYLKAIAYKEKLLKNINIEIPNNDLTDLDGDYFLINNIIEKKPDILGFSCYSWNLHRTFYFIKEIKKKLKKVKIIVGGPEVTTDNDLILNNNNIDIMVYGEGEMTFLELLNYFNRGNISLEKIKGVMFRRNYKIVVNSRREQISDLNEIPSPYLLDFIKPAKSGYMVLETTRGCFYRCGYCYYGKNFKGIRTFNIERIKEEIELAKKLDVRYIYLIDAVINFDKNRLENVCNTLKKINSDKKIYFQTEIRSELVDEKIARLLRESNIKILEAGLQSTNPSALANINRKNNLKKFKRGIYLLKKLDLEVIIGLIIGLPGDIKSAIKNSINFLLKNKITSTIHSYPLCILPGTYLRENARKFQIKFQKQPPYYVLRTKELSENDIREMFIFSERTFGREKLKSDEWFPSFSTCSCGKYTSTKDLKNYGRDEKISCFTKVILHFTGKQSLKNIEDLAEYLCSKISAYCTIWFDVYKIFDVNFFLHFLEIVLSKNPNIACNVIFELNEAPEIPYIFKIKKCLSYYNDYLNNSNYFYFSKNKFASSERLFIVLPFEVNNKNINKLDKIVPVFFYSKFEYTDDLIKKIELLCSLSGTGLLIDLPDNINGNTLYKALNLIKEKNKLNKIIRFRNFAFQRIWNIEIQKFCQPLWLSENIIEYDKDLNCKIRYFDEEKLFMDAVEWKISKNKIS